MEEQPQRRKVELALARAEFAIASIAFLVSINLYSKHIGHWPLFLGMFGAVMTVFALYHLVRGR